jgi:hypothetical protein
MGGAVPPPTGIGLGPKPAMPGVGVSPPSFMVPPQAPAARPAEKKPTEPPKPAYIDDEPPVDQKAVKFQKTMMRICLILAIPCLVTGFCIGKTSPDWSTLDRSAQDATTILDKLKSTGPILETVQSKTAAALTKSGSNEVDESFLDFIEEKITDRPFQVGDVDRQNYLAFQPETVDKLYEFAQLIDRAWADLGIHRNFTRQDINAIKSVGFLGEKRSQVVLGAVLMNLYDDQYGVDLGIVSNPGLDSDRNKTLDVQARAGRPSDPLKYYTKGSFGDKASNWVIPLDPAVSAQGGPLYGAEESHWDAYVRRLNKLNERLNRATKLHGELMSELGSIAE